MKTTFSVNFTSIHKQSWVEYNSEDMAIKAAQMLLNDDEYINPIIVSEQIRESGLVEELRRGTVKGTGKGRTLIYRGQIYHGVENTAFIRGVKPDL